jgi:DNA polymerase
MLDTSGARSPRAAFALGDICFFDFETTCAVDIGDGTDKYARHANAVLLAWAIGDGPVHCEAVHDFPSRLRWIGMPTELHAFLDRVDRGEAVLCAHNVVFDRAIWNYACDGFPQLEPWMVIDSRAQALASGLPGSLEGATHRVGASIRKSNVGSSLIKLFTLASSTATPITHPKKWEVFKSYAVMDVASMRELYKRTLPLSFREWQEFWAAERVNDAGICIDLPLVEAAAAMAERDKVLSARELQRLTMVYEEDGSFYSMVHTVNQVAKIIDWLNRVLEAEGREILMSRKEVVDPETKEITRPKEFSLERDRVVRLIAYVEAQQPLTEPLAAALRVLQIRLYGGSKTPAKFGKMLQQHVGGVIRCQYVFNGASQTGRFSARGIQVHNLARDPLPYEIDAIDGLTAGINAENFAALGDDTPISRKLSLLIRPSLVPEPGQVFCWGDWSNIEARLVPWLADDRDAEKRLDIFRAVDDGSEKFDIYTRTAAQLSGLPLEEAAEKSIRQRGKVVELACGFGGGQNALLSMAASYGIHLERNVAKAFVERWREENQWAVNFWGRHDTSKKDGSFGLWGALNKALSYPMAEFSVGRVSYVFLPSYLEGSLVCRLPSGRLLVYRRLRWEDVDVLDDNDVVIGTKRELMFRRDESHIKLWPGLACENIVQATAADILRGTLVRLDDECGDWMPVRLHTHDEVLVECAEETADDAANQLLDCMQQGFTWSKGLPIAADTVVGRWYSKSKGSIGL